MLVLLIAQWHTPVPPSKPPLRADDWRSLSFGAFPRWGSSFSPRWRGRSPELFRLLSVLLVPQQLAPRASSLTVVISNTLAPPAGVLVYGPSLSQA